MPGAWSRRAVHGAMAVVLGLGLITLLQLLNMMVLTDHHAAALTLPPQHDVWPNTTWVHKQLQLTHRDRPNLKQSFAKEDGSAAAVAGHMAATGVEQHRAAAEDMHKSSHIQPDEEESAQLGAMEDQRRQQHPQEQLQQLDKTQQQVQAAAAAAAAAADNSTIAAGVTSSTAAATKGSIAVPPFFNAAVHKRATALDVTARGAAGHHGRTTAEYVSAAEAMKLMQKYSAALTALSAVLVQARQRSEEVTALKVALDEVRLRQHKQLHPEKAAEKNPLLLGQQQQQQQQASTAIVSPTMWAEQRKERNHVRIFIGVYTGMSNGSLTEPRYNYTLRRQMLRQTWFPGTEQDRQRFESQHGIILRFVVGSVSDPAQEAVLQAEQREHGDILRLPLQESYFSLPNKTRTFFKIVTDNWEPDWVLKMDDDVFLNPSRLLAAAKQWDTMGAGYVGCMKHGYPYKLPGTRWFEPMHLLVGYTYWLHAYGSIYAISGAVARSVISANFAQLRLLANEDTSVGLWMLSANVTFFEDMRLCSPICTPASVAVLRNECAGLCDPLAELPVLHANSNCSAPPGPLLRYHSSYPEHKAFERMWVA